MQIYIHRNNQQLGPFTESEIRAQLAAGTISPEDHVWWQGQANWVPLSQSPLLTGAASVTPNTPPTPAAMGTPLPTSQLAIWSLVSGCLSIFCSLLSSIPAVILGHMALSQIKKNPAIQGRGIAIAGTIIGYVFIVLFFVSIAVLVSLGNQVQNVFKTIQAQENAELTNNADQNATTPDQTTNAPDQTMPAPATTPDQSTNSAPATTNAPDSSSTNSTPDTNAAPMSQ
jgi:hypothetical protein